MKASLYTTMLISVCFFAVGLILGIDSTNSTWEKDCSHLGKHRVFDTAYFCSPEGGK